MQKCKEYIAKIAIGSTSWQLFSAINQLSDFRVIYINGIHTACLHQFYHMHVP